MRWLLIKCVRAYQMVLSPLMGSQCRFYPTCSHYSIQALEDFGAVKGSWLAIKRIGRCNPYHDFGYDAVPGREAELDAELEQMRAENEKHERL